MIKPWTWSRRLIFCKKDAGGDSAEVGRGVRFSFRDSNCWYRGRSRNGPVFFILENIKQLKYRCLLVYAFFVQRFLGLNMDIRIRKMRRAPKAKAIKNNAFHRYDFIPIHKFLNIQKGAVQDEKYGNVLSPCRCQCFPRCRYFRPESVLEDGEEPGEKMHVHPRSQVHRRPFVFSLTFLGLEP